MVVQTIVRPKRPLIAQSCPQYYSLITLNSSPDQTIVRLDPPLVKLECSRSTCDQTISIQCDLWSDNFQASCQTKVRSKNFPEIVIWAPDDQVLAQRLSHWRSLWSRYLDLGEFTSHRKWKESWTVGHSLLDENYLRHLYTLTKTMIVRVRLHCKTNIFSM